MTTPHKTNRIYQAVVWQKGPDQTGERITLEAKDLDEAKNLLENQYGKDSVFSLYNAEDADKIR